MGLTFLQGDIEYEIHPLAPYMPVNSQSHWLKSREDDPVPIGTVRVIRGKLYYAESFTKELVPVPFKPPRYAYDIRWGLFLPKGRESRP